jgi:hypothetical protein
VLGKAEAMTLYQRQMSAARVSLGGLGATGGKQSLLYTFFESNMAQFKG